MKSHWLWIVFAALAACGPDSLPEERPDGSLPISDAGGPDAGGPDAGPPLENDGGTRNPCATPQLVYSQSSELKELEGCREVGASLVLTSPGVNDLSSLARLEVVKGSLSLSETGLKNLDELRSLRRVQGTLSLKANAQLVRVDGLRALESVALVDVTGNDVLEALEGWGALTSVNSFTVLRNRSLTRLAGFEKVVTLLGLAVGSNPLLSEIDAFAGLTTLPSLEVSGNEQLVSLKGLNKLESTDSVRIGRNPKLSQLAALGSLKKASLDLSLTDLPALTNLQSLGRFQQTPELTLSGLGVANFSELSALTRVSGSLIIQNNLQLTTLQAFSALTKVGDEYLSVFGTRGVVVKGNPLLRDLTGLNMIVGGSSSAISSLQVEDNQSLERLTNPIRIARYGTRVSIRSNPKLQSLEGMEATTDLSGLVIRDNASLRDLRGLQSLKNIGEYNGGGADTDIVLEKLPLLKDLQGLEKLESVFGKLSVSQCDGLVRLTGLEGLGGDWLKNYQVFSNPSLPLCAAQNLLERLKKDGYTGPSTVTGNTGTGTCP